MCIRDSSYTVEFGDFAVTSKLVNIDVPGYGQSTKNLSLIHI